jgi:competence ComEA-like helix-hairpin-helix protein
MRRLLEFASRLGFTPREVQVVLFLALTMLAGLALRRSPLFSGRAAVAIGPERYAEADSEFVARARMELPDSADNPNRQSLAIKRNPGRVDLNSATLDQLTQLPGIKGAYAGRIIAYREAHGRFVRVDDLLNIRGIGPKRLERLRPFVTVSPR